MGWVPRQLRGTRVFARTREDGQCEVGPDGRVDIVYKLHPDAKIYRAAANNLVEDEADSAPVEMPAAAAGSAPTPAPAPQQTGARTKRASASRPSALRSPSLQGEQPAPDAGPPAGRRLIVYTDGACTGNPGPAGLGAIILDGSERRELSEYLGQGTNNIAELTAIARALQAIPAADRSRPIAVHTDSSYSIGVLSKGWRARANVELIAEIRRLMARFPHLELIKVAGHAGIPENERADELARQAIQNASQSTSAGQGRSRAAASRRVKKS